MSYGWVSACPPGDFEPHAGLLLSLTELAWAAPQTMVELIGALAGRIGLLAVVLDESQRQHAITTLVDWGVDAGHVQFVFMPVGTWARDFGPSFVRWSDGSVVALDAKYYFPDRPNEAVVPSALASLMRLPRRKVPLVLSGGDLLSNGRGLCLFSGGMLTTNEMFGQKRTAAELAGVLAECYGFSQSVMLEPLVGHRTAHVDMIATFTSAETVVVAQVEGQAGATGDVLDENARRLEMLRTREGRQLRVVRIPMPAYRGEGGCRSYTNVIYANGRLLVPHYQDVDPRLERRVMAVYRELLPDWDIRQIDCSAIIAGGGALRCLSTQIPWLYDRFEVSRG
jgi:agmatine deiminase